MTPSILTDADRAELARLSGLARTERRDRKRKQRRRDLIGALTREQVAALIARAAASSPRDHALVQIGYHFGLRAGEFGRLPRAGVRIDAQPHAPLGEVRVEAEKDSVSQTQPIQDPRVRDALGAWLAVHPGGPFVFPGRGPDRGFDRRTVYELIRDLGLAAGLPRRACYAHILKATCATHLLDDGVPMVDVQAWIRHKSISSTQRYAKLTEAHQRVIADAFTRRRATP